MTFFHRTFRQQPTIPPVNKDASWVVADTLVYQRFIAQVDPAGRLTKPSVARYKLGFKFLAARECEALLYLGRSRGSEKNSFTPRFPLAIVCHT